MLKTLCKTSAISLITLLLVACGSRIDAVSDTIKYAAFGNADITLTKAQIAEKKYPLQYLTLEDQARIVLGLGFDDKGRYKWLSQSQEVLVTQNGRVVQTQGLEKDLEWVSNLAEDPLACITKGNQNCATSWSAKVQVGNDLNATTEVVESHFKKTGQENLQMPDGTKLQTQLWSEKVVLPTGKTWTNTYWVEIETNRVVKSDQRISTQFPRARLEEVKPYARDLETAGDAQ